jgi:hypothetical protein
MDLTVQVLSFTCANMPKSVIVSVFWTFHSCSPPHPHDAPTTPDTHTSTATVSSTSSLVAHDFVWPLARDGLSQDSAFETRHRHKIEWSDENLGWPCQQSNLFANMITATRSI